MDNKEQVSKSVEYDLNKNQEINEPSNKKNVLQNSNHDGIKHGHHGESKHGRHHGRKHESRNGSEYGHHDGPKHGHHHGSHKRSFLERNAFFITLLLNGMIDGLALAAKSQYRYRFFHSKYASELYKYNVSKECGVSLQPEVQVSRSIYIYTWNNCFEELNYFQYIFYLIKTYVRQL